MESRKVGFHFHPAQADLIPIVNISQWWFSRIKIPLLILINLSLSVGVFHQKTKTNKQTNKKGHFLCKKQKKHWGNRSLRTRVTPSSLPSFSHFIAGSELSYWNFKSIVLLNKVLFWCCECDESFGRWGSGSGGVTYMEKAPVGLGEAGEWADGITSGD